jgi:hypothetical protein
MKKDFSTKKLAVAALQGKLNPKGEYQLKVCPGENGTVSYLRCTDGKNGGDCTWCAKIKSIRLTEKEKRSRKFSISTVCTEHKNCGKADPALDDPSSPARKKARTNTPSSLASSREDWSTPTNKAKMTEVIHEIRTKDITQAAAAEKYGIPVATLNKTVTGRRQLHTKKGRRTALPQEIEQAIELYCLGMSDAALGITPGEVSLIAQAGMAYLRPDHGAFKASSTWVTRFISRFPRLSKRRAQALERNRASGFNKDVVDAYFVVLGEAIAKCEESSASGTLPDNFRMNLDESAAISQGEGKVVLGRRGDSAVHTVSDTARSVSSRMSQVALISAGDARFQPSYIIEGVEMPVDEIQPDGSLRKIYLATASGHYPLKDILRTIYGTTWWCQMSLHKWRSCA